MGIYEASITKYQEYNEHCLASTQNVKCAQLQSSQTEQAIPPQSSEPTHRNQDVYLMPRKWVLGKLPSGLDPPLRLHFSLSWTARPKFLFCFLFILFIFFFLHVSFRCYDPFLGLYCFMDSTVHVKTTFSFSASRAGWGLDKLTRTLGRFSPLVLPHVSSETANKHGDHDSQHNSMSQNWLVPSFLQVTPISPSILQVT